MALPLLRLPASLAHDELANGGDQAGFLRQPDKLPGHHQPALRVAPAHQGFSGLQAAAGNVQFGLVEHFQLLLVDGLAQLVLQLQTLQGAGALAFGEELESVAPRCLACCMAMLA